MGSSTTGFKDQRAGDEHSRHVQIYRKFPNELYFNFGEGWCFYGYWSFRNLWLWIWNIADQIFSITRDGTWCSWRAATIHALLQNVAGPLKSGAPITSALKRSDRLRGTTYRFKVASQTHPGTHHAGRPALLLPGKLVKSKHQRQPTY